jgi:hypothetical protein
MIPDSASSDSAPPRRAAAPSNAALGTKLSYLSAKEPYPDPVTGMMEFNRQFYNINAKPLDLRLANAPIYTIAEDQTQLAIAKR